MSACSSSRRASCEHGLASGRAADSVAVRGACAVARRPGTVRRRRIHVGRLVLVLLAVTLVAWGGARVAFAVAESSHPVGIVHVVQAGDTVWQIVVDEYGSGDQDVRVLVDKVLEANHMSRAVVRPGQRLVLPPASG
jgi:hypothetical protein